MIGLLKIYALMTLAILAIEFPAVMIVEGCAAKKLPNVRYQGCIVTQTWTDPQGDEHKDVDCTNCTFTGATIYDQKTGKDRRVAVCK